MKAKTEKQQNGERAKTNTKQIAEHQFSTTNPKKNIVQPGLSYNTVVEGFGVKLRISFHCPIFVSTFMFIFIYLFPYFGGDWAALVPTTTVVGLGVQFWQEFVHFDIHVYLYLHFRFCPPLCSLVCPARLFPLVIRPACPFPLPNICYVCQA